MILYRLELLLAYFFYYTGIYWAYKNSLKKRGARVVLVYHRIFPGKHGLGTMVSERSFESQMDYLSKNLLPVSWEDILKPAVPGSGIKVLVTFDDGYRDNFTRALPLLEKYRIPAVFFTVTDLICSRKRIFPEDAHLSDEELFATDDELKAAARSPYLAFGNHTSSHKIVTQMSREEFESDIRLSQDEFSAKFDKRPQVFAFPRGRKEDISADCAATLRKFDITAAFTMVPGLVSSQSDPYLTPRIGVSYVNNEVLFKVKTLGLLASSVKIRNRLAAAVRPLRHRVFGRNT